MTLVWLWTAAARAKDGLEKFQAVQRTVAEGTRRNLRRRVQIRRVQHEALKGNGVSFDIVGEYNLLLSEAIGDDIDMDVGRQMACPLGGGEG